MNDFKTYLIQRDFSFASVRRYINNVEHFLQNVPQGEDASYQDVVMYLGKLTKEGMRANTKRGRLSSIKKYFDFLVETGKRKDHPCRVLYVKGAKKRGVIFNDLFSMQELELLLEREERYEHLTIKNRLMASFLIYQALLPKEIVALKLSHVDVESELLFVKGGKINMQRHLDLHPMQLELIEQYLTKCRDRLIGVSGLKTNALLLNFRGMPITVEDVQFLTERAKYLFPDRNLTAKSIRDSVIAHLMNIKRVPLEQVQLFAGHRWVSSTLRYRKPDMSERRKVLNQFHPLG